MRPLDVLLVVPYDHGSHRQWARGWRRNSRHRVRIVAASSQLWRWNMSGGVVELAAAVWSDIAANGHPDVLMVSSLTDTAALLGLVRRDISGAVVVLYQHESQLLYPGFDAHAPADRQRALVEWRSLFAADAVWVNSEFHRDALIDRVETFLAEQAAPSLTDGFTQSPPLPDIDVLPVGVDLTDIGPSRRDDHGSTTSRVVMFNQRWDADKRPARVVKALESVVAAGHDVRVVLAGEPPPHGSDLLDRARLSLADRLVHAGYADRSRYVDLLHLADIVVADADHEFFGVSTVEAIAAGCIPLLPDRLVYPGLVGGRRDLLHSSHDLVPRLIEIIEHPPDTSELAAVVRRFDWSVVAPLYDERLEFVRMST